MPVIQLEYLTDLHGYQSKSHQNIRCFFLMTPPFGKTLINVHVSFYRKIRIGHNIYIFVDLESVYNLHIIMSQTKTPMNMKY